MFIHSHVGYSITSYISSWKFYIFQSINSYCSPDYIIYIHRSYSHIQFVYKRSFPSVQKYSKSHVTLFFLADLIYKSPSTLVIFLPDKA